MNFLLGVAVFLAALAFVFLADAALAAHARARVKLNLSPRRSVMFNTEKRPLSIAPTATVNGADVPATVYSIVWSVDDPAKGAVNTTSPDSLAAVFVPAAGFVGSAVVTVKANTKADGSGSTLAESATLDVVAPPPPEANKLNLKVGDPIPAA